MPSNGTPLDDILLGMACILKCFQNKKLDSTFSKNIGPTILEEHCSTFEKCWIQPFRKMLNLHFSKTIDLTFVQKRLYSTFCGGVLWKMNKLGGLVPHLVEGGLSIL